jgi:predicted site-specific integrase-resolvase
MTLKRWKDKDIIKYKKLTANKYLYDIESILKDDSLKMNIVYSRVYKSTQKEELFKQSSMIKEYMIKNGIKPDLVIEDIGSCLNSGRKGFNQLLDLVLDNKIDTVYISCSDRFSRFGFEQYVNIFLKFGTKIEIINLTYETTFQEELIEDLISTVHHFSSKINIDNKILKDFIKILKNIQTEQ